MRSIPSRSLAFLRGLEYVTGALGCALAGGELLTALMQRKPRHRPIVGSLQHKLGIHRVTCRFCYNRLFLGKKIATLVDQQQFNSHVPTSIG